ncbi:hypothetical protein D051_0854 [Vibrio parahaemolyticus VPCR-2010]|uniref:hypothetical protein n=1 Tax=Vibrio parahaemolyticus TaxID=670 RepID=UPI00038E6AEA|nr:hypothetical protein D051_0854 [Vibrio parahaemolyticus VPCR-2010]
MKVHNFNIKEEDKVHDCVLIERDDAVQYIFPFEVIYDENGSKAKMLEFKKHGSDHIVNPMGFIVDRISRLRDYNKSFTHVIVGDDEAKINENYIQERKTRDVLFVDGIELEEGGSVQVVFRDKDGNVTRSEAISHLKGTHVAKQNAHPHGVFRHLIFDLGQIPKKVDDNGNPRFTKNPSINKFLMSNGIYKEDVIEGISQVLNCHFPILVAIAKEMEMKGIDRIYLELIIEPWGKGFSPTNYLALGDFNYISQKNVKFIECQSPGHTVTVKSILDFE